MDEKQINQDIPKQNSLKKKIIVIILIIAIIATVVLGVKTAISINNWKSLITEMSVNKNSVVKDTDGTVIAEIGSEKAKELDKLKKLSSITKQVLSDNSWL